MPRSHRLWTACLLLTALSAAPAATNTVSVSATVLSKSQCNFSATAATLAFGAINPSGSAAATQSTSLVVRCGGSAPNATFSISHDSGLYETAVNANRMRHATVTTEYLPYSLSISPASATIPKNTDQTITISGSVAATDYQNAYAGGYADTVVLTLVP